MVKAVDPIVHWLDIYQGYLARVGIGLWLSAGNKILDVLLPEKTEVAEMLVRNTKPGQLALVDIKLCLHAANKILDVMQEEKTEGK